MNKHCFRLIFSKPLGFLIPVAEIATSQRKPGQQQACSPVSLPLTPPAFSLKRIALSLLLAGAPGWAAAEIILDRNSGGTSMGSAANGVPVIEIANPNGSGLSHNRFGQFDVSNPGVIFNNSLVNGTSQIGGAVLLNPNLKRTARAILTEVTGNKPSSISGTLEVFGDVADLLIANLIIDTAPLSTAASSVQSPEVIEMEAQPNYFRPWIKPEPANSPPPVPEFDNPIFADAPVKKEVPILRHRIDNTVPILQGDNGEDILLAALQTSQKNKQSSDLQELLDRMKLTFGASTKEAIVKTAEQATGTNVRAKIKNIKDDVGERARWLATLSGEERARYMESWMEVEEVPGMGRGVKAVRDIPPFTVLAPYAGKLLSGDAINAEWEKLGMNFTNYTFGTKSANTLISAFGDGIGNISSLVNKADDPTQNNVTVMLLGGKLVYLMNDRPISAGEALLYDYGEAYDYSGWPKHPILVQDSEPSDASGTESEIE